MKGQEKIQSMFESIVTLAKLHENIIKESDQDLDKNIKKLKKDIETFLNKIFKKNQYIIGYRFNHYGLHITLNHERWSTTYKTYISREDLKDYARVKESLYYVFLEVEQKPLMKESIKKEFTIRKGSRVLIQSRKLPHGFYDIISITNDGKTVFVKDKNNEIVDVPISDVKKTGYESITKENKRDKVLQGWSTNKIRNEIRMYKTFDDKESRNFVKDLQNELRLRGEKESITKENYKDKYDLLVDAKKMKRQGKSLDKIEDFASAHLKNVDDVDFVMSNLESFGVEKFEQLYESIMKE